MIQVALPVLGCLLSAVHTARAALGTGYNLTCYTTASGGGTSNGGEYTLTSMAGQADVGILSSLSHTGAGGFWDALGRASYELFVAR